MPQASFSPFSPSSRYSVNGESAYESHYVAEHLFLSFSILLRSLWFLSRRLGEKKFLAITTTINIGRTLWQVPTVPVHRRYMTGSNYDTRKFQVKSPAENCITSNAVRYDNKKGCKIYAASRSFVDTSL
jgi:hypothetical protein